MSSRRAERRRRRRHSCDGKRRFRTYVAAKLAARALLRDKGEECVPYRCGFCGAIHIGHKKRH